MYPCQVDPLHHGSRKRCQVCRVSTQSRYVQNSSTMMIMGEIKKISKSTKTSLHWRFTDAMVPIQKLSPIHTQVPIQSWKTRTGERLFMLLLGRDILISYRWRWWGWEEWRWWGWWRWGNEDEDDFQVLLLNGADVNSVDGGSRSALLSACWQVVIFITTITTITIITSGDSPPSHTSKMQTSLSWSPS